MKRIFAATIATLLLCSGSAAHAQSAAGQLPMYNNAPITDPALDPQNLAPNQREYLLTSMMSEQPGFTPDMMNKFKDMYEKSKPEMQLQMITQVAQQLQTMPIVKAKILKGMPPAEAPAK